MNTPINISFTLGDIVTSILVILGVIALVYLILILKDLYYAIEKVRTFCNDNSEEIDIIVKDGAEIIRKVEGITSVIPDEPLTILSDFKGNISEIFGIVASLFKYIKKKDN